MTDEIDMVATQDQTYAGQRIKIGARIKANAREARTLLALQRARHLNADDDDGDAGVYETRVMTAVEPRTTRAYKRRDVSAK